MDRLGLGLGHTQGGEERSLWVGRQPDLCLSLHTLSPLLLPHPQS